MTVRDLALRGANLPGLPGLLSVAERLAPAPTNRPAVLTYHRLDEPGARAGLNDGLISATPSRFVEQMEIVARDYHVIAMQELLEARRSGSALPPSSVLITFDDAYRDFAEHGWPVLRRMGLPVTLFVPTAYPDRPDRSFWWDRLYAAVMESPRVGTVETEAGTLALGDRSVRASSFRAVVARLKGMTHAEMLVQCDRLLEDLQVQPRADRGPAVLGWDELRQLEQEGVTLAAHSRTHPRLDRIPPEMLAEEIGGSWSDLEEAARAPIRAFAYPDGGHSDAVVAAVADAGFEVAFSTERGGNRLGRTDWLRLRRINVGQRTNAAILRGQLLVLTRVTVDGVAGGGQR